MHVIRKQLRQTRRTTLALCVGALLSVGLVAAPLGSAVAGADVTENEFVDLTGSHASIYCTREDAIVTSGGWHVLQTTATDATGGTHTTSHYIPNQLHLEGLSGDEYVVVGKSVGNGFGTLIINDTNGAVVAIKYDVTVTRYSGSGVVQITTATLKIVQRPDGTYVIFVWPGYPGTPTPEYTCFN
jgi:hypothetical protein